MIGEDVWRFQYRVRPYLDNASQPELETRLHDIMRNLSTITPEGKIGVTLPEDGGTVWKQRLIDLNLECYRRNSSIDDLGDHREIPYLTRNALEIIRANPQLEEFTKMRGIFCKFGKAEFMKLFIEEGRLRIRAASYYRELAGDDYARQDDELTLKTYITPYDFDLGLTGSMTSSLPGRGWILMANKKPSDHYIYCVTVIFDCRFIFDFHADSCVIIRNQDEFVARLLTAVQRQIPGWNVTFDTVRYMDPYWMLHHLTGAGNSIYLFKDWRFMYQREHRLIAIPPDGFSGSLDHLDISLGSIEDIATFVHLPS